MTRWRRAGRQSQQCAPNATPANRGESTERAQLKRELAGLSYREQLERLRPARPPGSPVQMQAEHEPPVLGDLTDDVLERATGDYSLVPEGPARIAAAALELSDEPIDRNTAENLASGFVTVFYIEDCETPDHVQDLVEGYRRRPSEYTILVHPRNGRHMWLQLNTKGFLRWEAGEFFGWRALSPARWTSLLVHETSHATNVDPTTPVESYQSEFRAYWVADFRDVEDLDVRAAQIKEWILDNYPLIRAPYDSNPEVRAAVDAHTRPDGNLTNEAPETWARARVSGGAEVGQIEESPPESR